MLFPAQFIWGVSSSAYQTEDVALSPRDRFYFKTDWDLFYDSGRLKHAKGDGTYSFTEYERDIQALKELGVSHYRFGVEWARVEPEPEMYSGDAIEQYVHIAKRLKQEGITPVVALWHFTFPSWLTNLDDASQHGWLHPDAKLRWPAYVEKVVEALAPYVEIFAPQNEPNTQASMGFLSNLWPPGTLLGNALYYRNMIAAAEAYRMAASIVRRLTSQAVILSIQNMVHWQKSAIDVFDIFYGWGEEFNFYHLDRVADVTDWIGFTYYMGEIASPVAVWQQKKKKQKAGHSDLGWPIDPHGLRRLLAQVADRYRKPVIVMENGIADESDRKRPDYLREHLRSVQWALQQGLDLRGYFHWSLVDNYEWAYGYAPKFGLFSMDKHNHALKPKASRDVFESIIKIGL